MSNTRPVETEVKYPHNRVGGDGTRMIAMKKRFKPVGSREKAALRARGLTDATFPTKENVVNVPVNQDKPLEYYLRKGLRPVDPNVLGSAMTDVSDVPADLREQIFIAGREEAKAELADNMPDPKDCPDCGQAFFAKNPQQKYCDPCRAERKANKYANPAKKAEPVAVDE